MKPFLLIILILLGFHSARSQNCTALGQNPETAFPVCGTASFSQSSVNICGDRPVPSRCPGNLFTDKNPYWYKFTCFSSGTLGFTIVPNNIGDDYDWQLFDVTGRDVRDVYNDVSLFVACNWSGDPGITGASPAGTSLVRCEGPGVPLFSSMPFLTQGRNYLLLVSHFTNTQSGYSLTFAGGTASITDPTEPHLLSASAACDGTEVTVRLNKKMKCRSLSANGSEFSIDPPISNVISAVGSSCNNGFDFDSVRLTLSTPLPPGNYQVVVGTGTDGNTLLDNCDRNIPDGDRLPLTVFPVQTTPMDSLVPPPCAPQQLVLVFRRPMRCTSIAANGSDFTVTGTYPVTLTGARGDCVNGLTSRILIDLAAPLQRAGTFQIRLQRGSDGNTIIDECGQETPAGQFLTFQIRDTVSADFTYRVTLGCTLDQIQCFHNGANGVNQWQWSFQGLPVSTQQNPLVSYSVFGDKLISLIVSNGTCRDTASQVVPLDNFLQAGFEASAFVCPGDRAIFRDTSIGRIVNWSWDFGNGVQAQGQTPVPQSYTPPLASNYEAPVRLIVTDDIGCRDTAFGVVTVVWNCYIAVPSAFTPNGDGLNDFLYPLNAYKARDLSFSVYNRFGQRIFFTQNWQNRWNGMYKGKSCDTGTYVWILQYTDPDTGRRVETKGTAVLIR